MGSTRRRIARGLRVVGHITLGLLLCALWLAPAARLHPTTDHRRTQIVRWWMRRLVSILAVRVVIHGAPSPGPLLFVANHISWLDIPCLLSTVDALFVAKREVARWPIIGRLATCAGTIFLERGLGADTATADMTTALVRGQSVVIFPEGTSTDGTGVRPFHARLYQAAISATVPVQAVAIRYPHAADSQARVPFVGDDAFVPHLWRLLGEPCIDAEIRFLPLRPSHGAERRALADATRHLIAGANT